MTELALVTPAILVALLYAQRKHYEYLERKLTLEKNAESEARFSDALKEFDAYKKRVDVLTLKAGFKL
jgi:hypothetical protein